LNIEYRSVKRGTGMSLRGGLLVGTNGLALCCGAYLLAGGQQQLRQQRRRLLPELVGDICADLLTIINVPMSGDRRLERSAEGMPDKGIPRHLFVS
jgi:hypothetical protein